MKFSRLSLFIALPIAAILYGCVSPPPTDRGVDGSSIAINDLSAEQKAYARSQIQSGLSKGISSYHLTPGDAVDMLFHINDRPEVTEYKLGVGDRIRVSFFYHPEVSTTMIVRPDGRITLPAKGDILAAGLQPEELEKRIREVYADMFKNPVVTVSVEEFTTETQDLKESLSDLGRGRTRKFQVAPDGLLYPPLLSGIKVAGSTVDQARDQINAAYAKRFGNIEVSLQLAEIVGSRVFIFGEVKNPGAFTWSGPQTALQAVSLAGGWLPTAAADNIKVVYWGPDRKPRIRTVNLEHLAMGEGIEQDMIIPPNSSIYVPPSTITKLDRFMEQYIQDLLLFNGTNIVFSSSAITF